MLVPTSSSAGSPGGAAPSALATCRAVAGRSCIRPRAPADDTASGSKWLSWRMTASTRSGSTACACAAAGEAREAELGEDARPLAMGSGELARERRRPLGRARLAHRLAPAEALLGEPGVVGAGVALGHVREELARLRPAPEAREHARLPVFRGDACHPRAPPGEPREGLGGGRHLAPEVADPRRAPACLRGERGVRVALGQARVGGPRIGPV